MHGVRHLDHLTLSHRSTDGNNSVTVWVVRKTRCASLPKLANRGQPATGGRPVLLPLLKRVGVSTRAVAPPGYSESLRELDALRDVRVELLLHDGQLLLLKVGEVRQSEHLRDAVGPEAALRAEELAALDDARLHKRALVDLVLSLNSWKRSARWVGAVVVRGD